jgi:hypothetical protein
MTRRKGSGGAVEEGQELGVIVGGGRCEGVPWAHTSDGLVNGWLRDLTRLLRFRRTSPRQGAWPMTCKTSGTLLKACRRFRAASTSPSTRESRRKRSGVASPTASSTC